MTTSKSTVYLGEVLVRAGLITEAQLREALRDQQSRRGYVPLGDVLLERNMVTPHQLEVLLQNTETRPRLGDLLVRDGSITKEQLAHALSRQRALHLPLGQVLVRLGYTPEATMRNALALQLNMRVIARMLGRSPKKT